MGTPITALELPMIATRMRGKITMGPDAYHMTKRIVIIRGATEDTANARDIDGAWISIYDYQPSSVPPTVKQLERRAWFKEAMNFYRSRTPTELESYQKYADDNNIMLMNAVISDYMKKREIFTVSAWDAGASTWDSGLSIWDSTWSVPWDDGASVWDGATSVWPE